MKHQNAFTAKPDLSERLRKADNSAKQSQKRAKQRRRTGPRWFLGRADSDRLMLAAPELLDSLDEMLIIYGSLYDSLELGRKDAIERSVIAKAIAAIAKATGEQE